MNKLKYTPGPWEWVRPPFWGGYDGIVGKNYASVLFPDCDNINNGAGLFFKYPSKADRKLIAAAPDMYEALMKIYANNNIEDIWHIVESIIEKLEEK